MLPSRETTATDSEYVEVPVHGRGFDGERDLTLATYAPVRCNGGLDRANIENSPQRFCGFGREAPPTVIGGREILKAAADKVREIKYRPEAIVDLQPAPTPIMRPHDLGQDSRPLVVAMVLGGRVDLDRVDNLVSVTAAEI